MTENTLMRGQGIAHRPGARRARVDRILRWLKGPDVLDVGCTKNQQRPDASSLHLRIRARFPSSWGIDIDREAVDAWRREGLGNMMYGDAHSFTLTQRFDSIVAGELIEHLQNPGQFLRTARRHLKPGGRIVLTTPYPFGLIHLLYALYKFPKTCGNPEHTQWFCPATMTSLAHRIGLRVLHWELVEDMEPCPESWRWNTASRLIKGIRWALPDRVYYNDMLFVLEPLEKPSRKPRYQPR